MKNGELVKNYSNLYGIANNSNKYPVKFSFAIAKNIKILKPLVEQFEQERDRIAGEYCKKNADGSPQREKNGEYIIFEEKKDQWDRDIRELLDIEVKVEPHMISESDYPDAIEPVIIMALEFMTQE